jgi:hypothetical protein
MYYFEQIRAQPDPFVFLSAIPTSFSTKPFFEEEWIDFKGMPQNHNDAKKIWSKALSGFSNITDGLIVWGIRQRKRRHAILTQPTRCGSFPIRTF